MAVAAALDQIGLRLGQLPAVSCEASLGELDFAGFDKKCDEAVLVESKRARELACSEILFSDSKESIMATSQN
eukprot:4070924-Lingulodinium_polyedra.AAC.1